MRSPPTEPLMSATLPTLRFDWRWGSARLAAQNFLFGAIVWMADRLPVREIDSEDRRLGLSASRGARPLRAAVAGV
jgi:hypothetical protein